MKAASFEYLRPNTLAEAIGALARTPDTAKLVAGSQSLGPMLNLRLVRPSVLIDVSRLDELRHVNGSRDEHMLTALTIYQMWKNHQNSAPVRLTLLEPDGEPYVVIDDAATAGPAIMIESGEG